MAQTIDLSVTNISLSATASITASMANMVTVSMMATNIPGSVDDSAAGSGAMITEASSLSAASQSISASDQIALSYQAQRLLTLQQALQRLEIVAHMASANMQSGNYARSVPSAQSFQNIVYSNVNSRTIIFAHPAGVAVVTGTWTLAVTQMASTAAPATASAPQSTETAQPDNTTDATPTQGYDFTQRNGLISNAYGVNYIQNPSIIPDKGQTKVTLDGDNLVLSSGDHSAPLILQNWQDHSPTLIFSDGTALPLTSLVDPAAS